jgi:hypothetical protein
MIIKKNIFYLLTKRLADKMIFYILHHENLPQTR